MAYNEQLADRLRGVLAERADAVEKKMFGGLAFMVDRKMSVGVLGDELVIRVAPEDYEQALKTKYVRPFDFTGKPLRGFLYIGTKAIESDEDLEQWVDLCLEYVYSLQAKKEFVLWANWCLFPTEYIIW